MMSTQHSGLLEVICGPMFSGKTEELIRRIRRAQIARQRVQNFKPAVDVRYAEKEIVSHSAQSIESLPVHSAWDILELVKDSTRVVAIDEVQFFDPSIVQVVHRLTLRGLRVICAGLDLDYRGIPFGAMGDLLAIADEVHKIQAICTICGAPATRTQRLVKVTDQFLLGEAQTYEARCRGHYEYEDQDHDQSNSNPAKLVVPQPQNAEQNVAPNTLKN